MSSYLVLDPGVKAHDVAGQLAYAVGAKAEYADDEWSEVLENSDVAVLAIDDNPSIGRNQQSGTDPYELARNASRNLGIGDWIAVSFRRVRKKEDSRWRKWFDFHAGSGSGSHHSRDTNADIITVFAGSHSGHDRASQVLTAVSGGMPGLDIDTHPVKLRSSRRLVGPVLAMVFALMVAIGFGPAAASLPAAGGAIGELVSAVATSALIPTLAWIVVGLSGGLSYLRYSDRWPHPLRGMWLDITSGVFPAPPRRRGRVRAPVAEKRSSRDDSIIKEESAGDYPLHQWTTKASPSVFASLAAPASGALAGQRQTSERTVPPPLRDRVGPLIGTSTIDETKAYLVAKQLHYGVGLIGEAGCGKSQLIRSLFGFDVLEQVAPSGLPGFPGEKNSLIAIENKGPDGASHYLEWARTLNQTCALIDLADETTFGIDFMPKDGSSYSRALRFVDALAYAFEDGSIQNQARTALAQTIALGLAVEEHPGVLDTANMDLDDFETPVIAHRSFAYYAHIFAGASPGGDQAAKRLFAATKAYASEHDDDDLHDCVEKGTYLFSLTASERLKRVSSSQNKIEQLTDMEQWFSPQRSKVTWRQIITSFKPTVVNFGPSITGTQVPERQTKLMSAIAMFTLQQEIAQTCAGWEEMNQWVSLYVDELSLLSGSSPEPIIWCKDKGRSFGVRTYFATQRPTQLLAEVAEMLLSMKTLGVYTQGNADVIDRIVRTLDLDGSGWQASDISQLPKYTAVIKTSDDTAGLSAFTLAIENFEADRKGFAQRQGYKLAA